MKVPYSALSLSSRPSSIIIMLVQKVGKRRETWPAYKRRAARPAAIAAAPPASNRLAAPVNSAGEVPLEVVLGPTGVFDGEAVVMGVTIGTVLVPDESVIV